MRAVVHDRYGPPDVLRLEEVEQPVLEDDQLLVRVHATTVSRTDCGLRSGHPFFVRLVAGLRRPKQRILGMEFAGVVEEVGRAVTGFAVGDEVFGVKGAGGHAELLSIRESSPVAHKPAGVGFAEAAALCDGAALALACLRKAGHLEGRRVLVYGASGSVGTAGVQLAKHFGCEVTAVCTTKNVELMRTLGADHVVDYTREDYTRNGRTYDILFDAVGKHSFRRARRSLVPGGVYLATDLGFLWQFPILLLLTRWIGSRRVHLGITRYSQADVLLVKELVEAGRYRAVVDRTYPLEQVVEATTYVETWQKTGNVVLTVAG